MAAFRQVEVTAAEKRQWIETRSALLWTCPAFTHILFTMLNPEKGELAAFFTDEVERAATDGEHLLINPAWFFKLPLPKRVFVTAHEILHVILNHVIMSYPFQQSGKVRFLDGTSLPYDARTMNIAMDLIINDVLIKSKIGEFPEEGCHDTSIATEKDSFLDAYRKLYQDEQKKGGGGGGGGGGGKQRGGFDQLLPPGKASGKNPTQASQQRSQAAWDAAIAGAISAAKVQGKLPAALERLLGEVLEPEVPWQEHIRALFNRKVGNSSYDWRRPDKRLIQRDIFSPRRSGHGCGTVVVGVDTSGSISQTELDVFFGEMRGILEDLRPSKLVLVWCDAKVHGSEEIDGPDDLRRLKAKGGGGTDFRPVFDWIGENNYSPDALVYFTDMYGSFPNHAPNYPVIWADISGNVKAPFGDHVLVPMRGKKK